MAALTKWIIGLVSAWILFTLIACICEYAWAAPTAEMGTKLQILLAPQWSIEGVQAVARTLWGMFWWDYPFLQSGIFVIFRYLGMAISFAIGFVIVIELITLAANSIGRLLGLAR